MMAEPESISETAAFIAIKFHALMQDPTYRRMFDDETFAFYDHQVSQFPEKLQRISQLACHNSIRNMLIGFEELMLPGDLGHILSRKWYMQNVLASALQDDFHQMIILGAGFDHLAIQAAKTGMTAVEIDKPATSALKQKILTQYKCTNGNPVLISCSGSAESIMKVIRQVDQINSSEPILIIAEGFWDYQIEHSNKVLAQQLARYFNAEIRIASTLFNLNDLAPFHRFVFKKSIRSVGEKLTFNTCKESVQNLFKDFGFRINDFQHARELLKRTIPSAKNLQQLNGFGMMQLQR